MLHHISIKKKIWLTLSESKSVYLSFKTKKKRYLDGISRYLKMSEPFSRDAFRDRSSVDTTSVAIFMGARGQSSSKN